MTEADRACLTDEWCAAHAHEWDAYHALPLAERMANQDKIEAALETGGPLAGRAMARALGLPFIPDELCDPVEVLEARAAEGDQWMRDVLATHTKLSADEIEELLGPMPRGRVDH